MIVDNYADVAVVIPVRNRSECIANAVQSVLDQSIAPSEIVIVDDASDDGTSSVLYELARKNARIKLLRNRVAMGANTSRNRGVRSASARFVAFQDSDDIWAVDKLRLQYDLVTEYPDAVVYCAFEKHYADGRILSVYGLDSTEPEFLSSLLRQNFISTQTVLAPRELLLAEPFDESLPRFQDWELWLRIQRLCEFRYVDKALVRVFDTPNSISRSTDLVAPAIRRMLETHSDLYSNDRAARLALLRTAAGAARQVGDRRAVVHWASRYARAWIGV